MTGRGFRQILALGCAMVIGLAAALSFPTEAKTASKSNKKASTGITVKYQKPDVTAYDQDKFPFAYAGLAPAMGSAVPTTGSFGEAYAAGNWKDASYYLMKDMVARFGYEEDPMSTAMNDIPYDEAYEGYHYALDGIDVSCDDNYAHFVYVSMPQLGKDFRICAAVYPGADYDYTTNTLQVYLDGIYYGLGWFCLYPGYNFFKDSVRRDENYLSMLDDLANSYDIVLRYPDANVAQFIGDQAALGSMSQAIGYSQETRLQFWNLYKKAGFDLTALTPDMHDYCNADCSSFVSAIAKSAGYVYNIPKLQQIHEYDTTYTMRNDYSKAGFQVLNSSAVGGSGLQRGDILVDEDFHTGVFVPEILFADKLPGD